MAISQGKVLENMEKLVKKISPDTFIFDFLGAHGFPKATITKIKNGDMTRNVGLNGDVGIKKHVLFRRVSVGSNLEIELEKLASDDVVSKHQIRFVIATDFQTIVAKDLSAKEELKAAIDELDKDYTFFLPLAGYEKAIIHSEHPADVRASEKMGRLFDLIKERNDLSKPEDIHALNVFLTRLLFCFYAEDTGIFQEQQVTGLIKSITSSDGSDVDQFFTDLFTVLNLPDDSAERKKMLNHFQAFPFVNGGLFRDDEPVPEFGQKARRMLIECGDLSWSEINPDIFGSMFQAVIDEEQRGNLGQHYTSVSNIMKVIQPLFLDNLCDDLEKSRKSEKKLKALLVRLQNLRIFDPACGSGNFLIIAYKELRKLEMEIIDALNAISGQSEMYYSGIRLAQFYGIEIDDFAHEVAVLSLWLAEHQMNMTFKAKFGYAEAALPLRGSGNIVCGNALRLDWGKVCSPVDADGNAREVFICGNPPFLGQRNHKNQHTDDMDFVFRGLGNYKNLDYVACWFFKAADFLTGNAKAAFVTTNSICQGSQVGMLWPKLFDLNCEIEFAYDFFKWSNSAKDVAGVFCSIIGLSKKGPKEKRIYKNDVYRTVKNINPYIVEAGNIIVESRTKPISQLPMMIGGNQPREGGFLTLSNSEKEALVSQSPESIRFIKPLVGTNEMLKGLQRWCIWIEDFEVGDALEIPEIRFRVNKVAEKRLKGNTVEVNFSKTPHRFVQVNRAKKLQFVIPNVSTSKRTYIPIGYMSAEFIITNLAMMIPDADLVTFGIINSKMHMDWVRAVAGRLGDGLRYTVGLCYNTFPVPEISQNQSVEIEKCAEEILLVREDFSGWSLERLYNPKEMPEPLLEAHEALDRAVEKLFRDKPFRDAAERLEHLFALHERLIAAEKATHQSRRK